jgi:hypothetical protein
MSGFEDLRDKVAAGDERAVGEVSRLQATGADSKEIREGSLLPALQLTAQRLRAGEVLIPQALQSVRVLQACLAALPVAGSESAAQPAPGPAGRPPEASAAAASPDVAGTFVGLLLQGAGPCCARGPAFSSANYDRPQPRSTSDFEVMGSFRAFVEAAGLAGLTQT